MFRENWLQFATHENQFGGEFPPRKQLAFAGKLPDKAIAREAMSDPSVTGVVHLIEETKTYGSKGFRKRVVVLEQDKGSFTNFVPVEFTRDSCDAVDEMNEGDEVEITYRLNGRRWQKDANSEVKFFVNVEATSFKITGNANPAEAMSERVSDPNAAFDEASEEDAPF